MKISIKKIGRWFRPYRYEKCSVPVSYHPLNYQATWPRPIRTAPEKCSFLRICDLYTFCFMCFMNSRERQLEATREGELLPSS